MTKTIQLLEQRFACKKYLNKEISKEALETILEAGRLSPSSFGFEPWEFHIVPSKDILDCCFNQESMQTAPITIVVTCQRACSYDPDGPFVYERGVRFPGDISDFIEDYRGYYYYLKEQNRLDSWSRAQAYIAVTNMMTAACELGIQSCAIEGFDNDKLLDKLNIDSKTQLVGLVCAFGYPAEHVRPKIREKNNSFYH